MSKVLLDLKDYKITDKGEVLFKRDALFELLRRGENIKHLDVTDDDDIRLYNRRHPSEAFNIIVPNDKSEAPSVEAYQFNIPEKYFKIPLKGYFYALLHDQFSQYNNFEIYSNRLELELSMIEDRQMEDFICLAIYISHIFAANEVFHGVGRGSSCACLLLYLLNLHMIDPILYEIDISEFLR